MKYRTVIFDIDGTLLNAESGVTRVLEYTLRRFGKGIPENFDKRRFLAPSMNYSLHHFFGLMPEEADAAAGIYRARYSEDGFSDTTLFPGARELLTDLKAAGVKIVIATARNAFSTGVIIEKYGLSGLTDYVAVSDGNPECNSKYVIIKEALAEAIMPAVMVGDTILDAAGARDNKIPFVGMTYGYGMPNELSAAGAIGLFSSMDGLRGFLFEEPF
ncbi:MAG: HAD hydrolase-like protein [Clostridiaceae bacterium]|jgi:phosphoglycolate phosphatase|nr:HAD hydrolase-like protein [Clostridiaceae bacterium]